MPYQDEWGNLCEKCIEIHLQIVQYAEEFLFNQPSVARAEELRLDQLKTRLPTMIANTQRMYGSVGIRVNVTEHQLFLDEDDEYLLDIKVICDEADSSEVVRELFAKRGGLGPMDVVIYYIRTLRTTYDGGCASHPVGTPGALIASGFASTWTLAHEMGHLLGLRHFESDHPNVWDHSYLMNLRTYKIREGPWLPNLLPEEEQILANSALLAQCP